MKMVKITDLCVGDIVKIKSRLYTVANIRSYEFMGSCSNDVRYILVSHTSHRVKTIEHKGMYMAHIEVVGYKEELKTIEANTRTGDVML